MRERLRAYYQSQGVDTRVFDAIAAVRPTSPLDFDRRVKAVTAFSELAEAESLAAANKRIGNLLKKNSSVKSSAVNEALFEHEAERALHSAMAARKAIVDPLFANGDYTSALRELAALREPIDSYFDQVMVMAEDTEVRGNRLAMLGDLHGLFGHVAELGGL